MTSSADELLDVDDAIARLQAALSLQYRSAITYTLAAGAVVGFSYQHLGESLWRFAEFELADARRLVEKLTALGADPTTEVARVPFSSSPTELVDLIIETEEEVTEALQACNLADRARGAL